MLHSRAGGLGGSSFSHPRAAHLALLYPGREIADRIAAAAADEFTEVDFWELTLPQADAIAVALRKHDLRVGSINVPRGSGDECGRMANPLTMELWRESFDETLAIATRIGASYINLVAGRVLDGLDQEAVLLANIEWAVERSRGTRVELLLEPLSELAYPGYLITSCAEATRLLARLADPDGVGLLFDAFHVASEGNDPAVVLREHSPWVRRVQIADAPGRGEPGSGHIDWPSFFEALAATYRGSVSFEYIPSDDHAGLSWISTQTRSVQCHRNR